MYINFGHYNTTKLLWWPMRNLWHHCPSISRQILQCLWFKSWQDTEEKFYVKVCF